jgi:hypothetical protein
MHKPAELSEPIFYTGNDRKAKFLPNRTDIVYRDNAGYNLTITNLPWGKDEFRIKRYRISKTQSLELVEERIAAGSSLKLSNPLPTDTIELIILQHQ